MLITLYLELVVYQKDQDTFHVRLLPDFFSKHYYYTPQTFFQSSSFAFLKRSLVFVRSVELLWIYVQ